MDAVFDLGRPGWPQSSSPGSELLTALYVFILFAALALAGAVLLRRWQSRRALVARLAELSGFAEVGRAIVGAQLDLGRLAQLVYEQAGKIVDTSIFQLGLFEGDRYRLLIWIVDGQPRPLAEFRLTPDSQGIVGWMRSSHTSLLVRDFEAELESLPARPRYIAGDPPRSAVFVPLLVGETALGAIAIQSRRAHAFTEEHLRLLTIVANHAAAALQNARLYEQAQHQAAQLQRLSEISQRINAIQSLPALYRQVVELAAEKFGDYAVSFFERRAETLALAATTRPDWRGKELALRLGDGPIGQAALEHRAILSQAWPAEMPDVPDEAAPETSPELSVPVEIDNQVLGVLNVQGRAGSALDANTVPIFKSLAAQMAIAILEGQMYEAERLRSEHLSALAQASRAVVSTLELDDLLDEVLDLVEEQFGYHQAHILFLQNDQLVFRAGVGEGAERWAVEEASFSLAGPGLVALTGRTQRPVRADDVGAHPDYLFHPALPETRSEMVVPMVMGQRLLGVFDVQSEQLAAFTDQDLQTLQTLADTLAVAIRNARLFEAERRRRRLAEILREVSQALTSTLHLDDVLSLILNGLARVVSYDAASILLVNALGELQLRASRGAPEAEEVLGLTLDIKLFPPGEALPAVVPFSEVDHLGEYHDLLALPDPHACLGAVLAVRGEHLGYLVVDYAGYDHFPAEEAELIAAFASQAAVAIENARLYTAQREQTWVSTALLQVAEATARASELKEVFETVARLTAMLVGVDRCAVLQAEDDQFILQAYHAADVEMAPDQLPHHVTPAEWPRLAEMLDTLEPVVLDSEHELPENCRALFAGVVILLPLLAKGRVEGALMVGQAPGEVPFTAQRIRLLGGIANQAAIAIESALLDRAQQEEAWVSTALLQVAQALAGQPTLAEGLETVARLTPMLVGLDRVVIYQWDAAAQTFRASQVMGLSQSSAGDLAHWSAGAADLGLENTEPTARAFSVTLPERLARLMGIETCMVWPLWARGDLLGALVVEAVHPLGRRLSILNGIAHQLAVAMESARLAREVAQQQRLERELEVSHDIQASFLPNGCPEIEGWEVCSLWRAARQVGGDFYDFIPLRAQAGGERWGIVVADVADKGVPAALFMALSRTLLRSVAIGRVSPAATLARVNQLILADAPSTLFVTVFYGVWEPATGHFRYANGGHNPPIWVERDGTARTLRGRGLPLGVLEGVEYEEHEIHLGTGEVLFLYTDGVTDAVNADSKEFGLGQLIEVVRQSRHGPASAIMDAATAAVEQHVGGVEAYDDMTMMVIKRL